MNDFFSTDFFISNRQKLLDTTNAQLIVLTANGLLQRSADTTFPFRQDSNFWYLTGIEEPDFVLVFGPDFSFLIAPKRAEHRDMWDGVLDNKSIQKLSGVSDILDHHEGWTRLDLLLKKQKKVHTIAPAEAYFDQFGFYANPARVSLLQLLQKHRKLEIVDLRKKLAQLRQIKQPQEILALTRAIEITSQTLRDVKKKIHTYKYEYEIAADITSGYIKRGAAGHAYQPIIASGKNATTIHYMRNDAAIQDTDLLLFDVGAEVSNYSADISRTYARQAPSKRQQQVYDAVKRVQQQAYDLLKPGVLIRQYEQLVDDCMAAELHRLGLLDDVSDRRRLKKYYPHLASHFLGLDTHDAADYELPLAPGMVLTVEPGLYIPEEGIGVRIEDNVLIVETGIKVLSDQLPSELL